MGGSLVVHSDGPPTDAAEFMNRTSMNVRTYQPRDREAVIMLWQKCGLITPSNDPGRDIDLKVTEQPELFFVGELEATIVATVMAGYDGHRGWINFLATSPDQRKKGLGREMMHYAEAQLLSRGCPKVNLQIRAENAQVREFYESLGYVVEARLSLGKRFDA